ncbi:hypothetical protein [Plebeiibacterium sediminum]|uniref:Uncharacterized protein n=1 Tax=Plebeiibacterium sediminum TaxID=2992112 RepID=A0AAE3M4X5_9BACT|nr:hypothetical protein [Plebeiobacterium sediminum]MCW3786954.1 hypothetical protein [Plebeiobacterium sediminum]
MKRYIQILFILSTCTSVLYGQKQYKDTLCILLDEHSLAGLEIQKEFEEIFGSRLKNDSSDTPFYLWIRTSAKSTGYYESQLESLNVIPNFVNENSSVIVSRDKLSNMKLRTLRDSYFIINDVYLNNVGLSQVKFYIIKSKEFYNENLESINLCSAKLYETYSFKTIE